VTEILRSTLGDDAARRGLADALGTNPFLFNYVGHGTTAMWGGTWLNADAVTAMWAPKPVALMMATTCLNGFFHDVYTTSMVETLLNMPDSGTLAAIGSSSLAELSDQVTLTQTIMRLALNEGRPLGEALQKAKIGLGDREVQQSYMLFGDPSAVLVALPKLAALSTEENATETNPGAALGCSVATLPARADRAGGTAVWPFAMTLLGLLWLRRRRGRPHPP
jgi:hypothetical protein